MDEMNTLLPPWATGVYTGNLSRGTQLSTKDGRRVGNAVVVDDGSWSGGLFQQWFFYVVVTDFGNKLELTAQEIEEMFHEPKWLMDIHTHAGYNTWQLDIRLGRD